MRQLLRVTFKRAKVLSSRAGVVRQLRDLSQTFQRQSFRLPSLCICSCLHLTFAAVVIATNTPHTGDFIFGTRVRLPRSISRALQGDFCKRLSGLRTKISSLLLRLSQTSLDFGASTAHRIKIRWLDFSSSMACFHFSLDGLRGFHVPREITCRLFVSICST